MNSWQFAQAMAESLGSPDDWAELWRASGRGEMATTHIPIIVHEDAVPHFSGALGYVCSTYCFPTFLSCVCPNIVFRGSTATIWSWSTGCVRGDSWKTRHCIAVLATPQVTANTRAAICKLLAWDLKQLMNGVWDVVDRFGHFHPTDSKLEKKAGHDMPLRAVSSPSEFDNKTCIEQRHVYVCRCVCTTFVHCYWT